MTLNLKFIIAAIPLLYKVVSAWQRIIHSEVGKKEDEKVGSWEGEKVKLKWEVGKAVMSGPPVLDERFT